MKTMLGGWEDVQRMLTAERAGRAAATPASASVSVRRCVAVTPRDATRPAALWLSQGPRHTRLGGLDQPIQAVAPRSAPPRSRPAVRKQPPPLPAHLRPYGSPAVSAHGSPPPLPLDRLPLDATCEIGDLDLIVMPAPPAAQPAVWGARRGGTALDPATARSSAGWLRRLRRWARRRLRALSATH